ncbi:hypothetical protein ACLF3G_01320 [Falsiroseomonas sp. HC035]|uniref:hypothetical protein n=1 Tax=Falsiroseomonas sp. HC035 TaxID=3390999 RepID=UPI003D3105CC
MNAALDPRGRPVIRGCVEQATLGEISGWAFEPGAPRHRVLVELRLDGGILAVAPADHARGDLVPAGIGDGAHGFRFALQPAWAARLPDLQVVARAAAGGAVLLPPQRRVEPPHSQVVQVINQLVQGQQALEARLQAVVPVRMAPDAEQRLAVLEAWMARLDDRLARLPAAPPAAPRGPDAWQVALGTLLALVSLGALIGFALLLAL